MTDVQPATRSRRPRLHIPRNRIPEVRWLRLPFGVRVPLPEREQLPWLAGLAIVAALDIVDWPVALALAIGHTVGTQARNQTIRELAEGIEAAA